MTTPVLAPPPLMFTPSADPAPVEQAVALSIASGFPPETYLWIECHQQDGGMHLWHAWTEGGDVLGDQVDDLAVAAGLDAADWLDLTIRHQQVSSRGRIVIKAHPLRPLLADVQGGAGAPADLREALLRCLRYAAQESGRAPRDIVPRWLGVGPVLTARRR